MSPATAKNLSAMIGERVRICWRDPRHDWPYYVLLEVSPDDSTLKLRGADYPDGRAKHDGDEFWVDEVDIEDINVVGREHV